MQTSHIENIDWRKEVYKFLFSYRVTHTSQRSYHRLMFHRKIRVSIPIVEHKSNQKSNDAILKKNHSTAQQRNQQYHDQRNHATDRQLTTGDTVLVKQPKYNKLTPNFKPEPYIVTDIKGTMITAQSSVTGKRITRNICPYKAVADQAQFPIIIREEEEGGEFEQQPQPENQRHEEPNVRNTYPERLRRRPHMWRKY